MSCMTRSSLRLSSGCVSWILMLHMGQYLLVCRYFTIQLLQTARGETRPLSPFGEPDTQGGCGVGQTAQKRLAGGGVVKDRAGAGTLTGVETLCDGGGIHEVAGAQAANDVFVQVFDLHSDLLLWTHPPRSLLTRLPHALPTSPLHFPAPERFLSLGLGPRRWGWG